MNEVELSEVKQFADNTRLVGLIQKFLVNTFKDYEEIELGGLDDKQIGERIRALVSARKLLESGFAEIKKLQQVGEPDKEIKNEAY